MDCIFCRIVAGTIPCHKLAETTHALAFLDINPLSHGHALVIPKAHAVHVHEVPAVALAEIGPLIARVAKATGGENYNVLQNNGSLAGQVVMHAHFHIIPKEKESGRGLALRWSAQATDHTAFAALAVELRAKLEAE